MAKIAIIAFLAAFVAIASAGSFGGVKDVYGNYWDGTTGQFSSAFTGKVYNTAPVAYIPPVAPVVAAAPYYYGGAYPYSYSYLAPAWKK